MNVEEAIKQYMDARGEFLRPLTMSYYRDFLERFTADMTGRNIGDIHASEFVLAWKITVAATLRPRSQKTYRAVICRWLDWCVVQDLIPSHEFRKVACAKMDAANRPKVTLQRFCALLTAAGTLDTEYERVRATALLWAAWACMLRWGEVIALRVDNLRLEADEPEILIEYGKGGKSAWLPLDYTAAAALRAWLLQRGEQEHNHLWCNWVTKDSPMGRAAWPRLLTRLGTIAGIDVSQCKTHGIRRGSATAMLQSGKDVATVSQFLRHSQIQTTWDYTEAGSLRMKEHDVRNWTSIALAGTIHVSTSDVPNEQTLTPVQHAEPPRPKPPADPRSHRQRLQAQIRRRQQPD